MDDFVDENSTFHHSEDWIAVPPQGKRKRTQPVASSDENKIHDHSHGLRSGEGTHPELSRAAPSLAPTATSSSQPTVEREMPSPLPRGGPAQPLEGTTTTSPAPSTPPRESPARASPAPTSPAAPPARASQPTSSDKLGVPRQSTAARPPALASSNRPSLLSSSSSTVTTSTSGGSAANHPEQTIERHAAKNPTPLLMPVPAPHFTAPSPDSAVHFAFPPYFPGSPSPPPGAAQVPWLPTSPRPSASPPASEPSWYATVDSVRGPVVEAVQRQMEYYLGKQNLCKDMFLRSHMDPGGFVALEVLHGFNKIRALGSTPLQTLAAVKQSPCLEVVVPWAVRAMQHAIPKDAAILGTLVRPAEKPERWVLQHGQPQSPLPHPPLSPRGVAVSQGPAPVQYHLHRAPSPSDGSSWAGAAPPVPSGKDST